MIGIARITKQLVDDLKEQGFRGDVVVTFNANVPTLESFSGSWTIEIIPKSELENDRHS